MNIKHSCLRCEVEFTDGRDDLPGLCGPCGKEFSEVSQSLKPSDIEHIADEHFKKAVPAWILARKRRPSLQSEDFRERLFAQFLRLEGNQDLSDLIHTESELDMARYLFTYVFTQDGIKNTTTKLLQS